MPGVSRQVCLILASFVAFCESAYKIGVGIGDVTGPAVGIPFMGYANLRQRGEGLHLRQFARAFIIGDSYEKLVFVSVDVGMGAHGVRMKVLKRLREKFGEEFSERNLMISGTHTHSAPGGFLMHFMFDISTMGFVPETYDALVSGIVTSITRARSNMRKGSIFFSTGEVLDANTNRSPSAYDNNPESEKARFEYNVDKRLIQMKFVAETGQPMGVLNWFPVHPTSMNNTNTLISSDNVGLASVLFEQQMNPGRSIGKGPFVAAFASSNLGDVSPNLRSPVCLKTGEPCDMLTSSCPDEHDMCVALGPGEDMFQSTKIIAQRILATAISLWNDPNSWEIKGPVRMVHQFVNMAKREATYQDPNTGQIRQVHGCKPAMGHSFAAGTTDGPGLFAFKQGTKSPDNPLWNSVSRILPNASAESVSCHGGKPILLSTGEMNFPFQWQPEIVPTHLATIGQLAVACVPGEFTTMAGRRLRTALRNRLGLADDTHVIIAGLCNEYSDYITTPEEYEVQRYEGASTIYGPETLPLYIRQYEDLADHILRKMDPERGPVPPEFLNKLIVLTPPVLYDAPPYDQDFGACLQHPPLNVTRGETVNTTFVSGHLRNNMMRGSSFLLVEHLPINGNKWEVVATDANWETIITWKRQSLLLGTSAVVIKWTVPEDAPFGKYRIKHQGYSKPVIGALHQYQGLSRVFQVVPKDLPYSYDVPQIHE
nr:PREDICTED: neutral ceramidase [Bemisia tabaci]